MAFHNVMIYRIHLFKAAKVCLDISARKGELKVITIGIYENKDDFKKVL